MMLMLMLALLVYVDVAVAGTSHSLDPSESMVELMNQQVGCRFELHRKRKQTSAIEIREDERAEPSRMMAQEKTSIIAHMHSLEGKNTELRRELDSLQLQVLKQKELKEELSSLQRAHASLSQKYHEERGTNKRMAKQLQDQLDETSLAKRKTEEQLLLSGTASESAASTETKSLLDGIQAKYSEEVSQLTSDNRVKDKTLQEMRGKRITLVRL